MALTLLLRNDDSRAMKWTREHLSTAARALVTLCSVIFLTACVSMAQPSSKANVRRIGPAKASRDVALYTGKPSQTVRELGIVESSRAKNLTPDVTAKMMKELQEQAAALGADAVVDVRRLADRHEGFVNNPRTPFPSVMQGEWKTYFFRGTAVRFVDR